MIAEVKNASLEQQVEFVIPDDEVYGEIIEAYLRKKGMLPKWASVFRKKLVEDWNTCSLPIKKKMWAIERGFMPSSVLLYGLDESNYQDYMSDLDYMKIHPLNNHFAFWINDKITLKNIFAKPIKSITNPEVEYNLMPEYYLYIENDSRFSYLMDSPPDVCRDEFYLLNLLKKKGILALKPSNGGGGYGFVKLAYSNGQIFWNDELICESQLLENQKTLNGYIVTEYIKQHDDFDAICDKSACTLRVIVVKNSMDKFNGGDLEIIASYARFGTEISAGACNMHAGAVAIAYNSETGDYGDYFFRYRGYAEGNQTRFTTHPDSRVCLQGKKLPKYEVVKDVVLTACSYLSSLEYFGVDVVITNDDVKILEINSLPAMSTPQVLCGPMFKNHAAGEFFKKKIDQKNMLV